MHICYMMAMSIIESTDTIIRCYPARLSSACIRVPVHPIGTSYIPGKTPNLFPPSFLPESILSPDRASDMRDAHLGSPLRYNMAFISSPRH